MGKSPRRKYSREVKVEAVKPVLNGRPVSEVAESLGINRNMLARWKTDLIAEGALAFPGQGRRNEAEEELHRLRRELAVARQERDILKKAVAYFANDKG